MLSSFCFGLGFYFTGDGCRRDADGYYWITGRVDDVINPSGHRIGTAEVESALVACPEVSESAVVGFPHDIKGEGIGCFVILRYLSAGSRLLRPVQLCHHSKLLSNTLTLLLAASLLEGGLSSVCGADHVRTVSCHPHQPKNPLTHTCLMYL